MKAEKKVGGPLQEELRDPSKRSVSIDICSCVHSAYKRQTRRYKEAESIG